VHEIFTKEFIQGIHFILTRHDTVINISKIKCHYMGIVTDFELRKMNIKTLKPKWSIYVPPVLIFRDCVMPTNVFMCFAWISEQTAIISLYSIN
jgi:hypothetical protein